MNSLEFIKSQVKELPEGCEVVRLDIDGEIIFSGGLGLEHNFYPKNFSDDLYDARHWTREEFEACDTSGRVSTVNRDIERVTANKYEREISDRYGNVCHVDVYDVLKAYDVTCSATQHAVKKLLCTGIRGHKDGVTDLIEAKDSITRAIELGGDSK